MSRPAAEQQWNAAVSTGLVRLAAGAALVRLNKPLVRLAGASSDDRLASGVFRAFGVRDAALGISALAASRPGGDVRKQLQLQAGLDAVDATVCLWLTRSGHLPRVRGIGCALTAIGSGVIELLMRAQLPAD